MRSDLLSILQHSIGADQYGRGSYRNHYVAEAGDADDLRCQELVAMGLMKFHGKAKLFGGSHGYTVTEAGVEAVKQHSPKPPKLSKAKRRYQYWLEISDCFHDATFRDFLTHPDFAEARARSIA